MTAKPEELDEPYDVERFRIELTLNIRRFIAKNLQLWATCENSQCRRGKRCAGPGAECIDKWSETLPPRSPEEDRANLIDFQKALGVRISLGETATSEQIAEAIEKERAERRAAMRLPESGRPAAVVEGTKLAPEQRQEIERALNDTAKEPDRTRDPGPRITQL
jgi:hypothetical protein